MGVRNEVVRLSLQDAGFISGVAKAAGAAALLDRALDGVDGSSIQLSRTTRVASKDIDGLSASMRKSGPDIDRFSGRLGLALSAIGAFGPALVPMTAGLVPVVAGLSTQLGFAAASAGVMVTAFQGVGDALEAVRDHELNPTVESLAKAQEALQALSPAAQAAVMRMRELAPVLRDIRDAAAQGFFPDYIDGLDSFERLAPRIESIFGKVAEASGGLFADSMASLAGPEWEDFFSFVEAEAGPALTTLGHTVGNLTKGLAELWMAMDPLSDDFTGGLLQASERFEAWAEGLSETQGYADFIAYVQETGPQVLDTLGSLGDMFLQIAEAASPLGGPVLKILEVFADAIAAIADSPLGTPIMAYVAALSALKLALAGAAAAQRAFNLSTMAQSPGRQGVAGGLGGRPSALKLGAGVTVATAGLVAAEKGLIGMNTVMGASIGMMAGPWGAAIGAGVGLLVDFADKSEESASATRHFERAMNSVSLSGFISEMEKAGAKSAEVFEWANSPLGSLSNIASTSKAGWAAVLNGGYQGSDIQKSFDEEMAKQAAEQIAENQVQIFGQRLARATGTQAPTGMRYQENRAGRLRPTEPIFERDATAGEMDAALEKIRPTMEDLGMTWQDVMDRAGEDSSKWGENLQALADELVNYNGHAESAAGRSEVLGSAIDDLSDPFISTARSASAFAAALDAALDPGINREQAVFGWHASLDSLKDSLAEGSRSLRDHTLAGSQNRAAIADRVDALKDMLAAEAAAGAGPVRLARLMREGRKALLDAAAAAGLNRKEVAALARQLGLTPKLVQTMVEVSGVAKAIGDVAALKSWLDKLPPKKRVEIVQTISQSGSLIRGMFADGGTIPRHAAWGTTVPKDGGPYADRFPYLLAPGEEVITNRLGQADRNRAALKAANAGAKLAVVGRLADGGTAGPIGSRVAAGDHRGIRSLGDEAHRSAKEIRKEREARREEIKARLDAARSARNDLRSTVTGNLRSDLWEAPENVWGAGVNVNPIATLRGDIRQARQFNRARKELTGMGLSGAAAADLFANADVRTVQAVANWSPQRVRQLENLYNTRQQVTAAAGRGTGEAVLGAKIDRLEVQLRKIHGQLKRNPEETGNHVGRGVDRRARNGARSGR